MSKPNDLIIFSTPDYAGLAERLTQLLPVSEGALETRIFPDGERYLRLSSSVRQQNVVCLGGMNDDRATLDLYDLASAIVEQGARRLTLAVPYFGYSRQDKRFSPGETISARVIGDMLARCCDGIAILDLHAPAILEDLSVPVEFVSAMPEIAARLYNEVNPDFILSPDKGAIDRASEVATIGGWDFSYLEKTRIDAHTIEHTPKDLDVNGKVVAIVDDMISTGGTICRASDALHKQGATEVHAACTHGLFTAGAISRLSNHVDGVHSTDSLPNPRAVVSAAPALARGLRKLMG